MARGRRVCPGTAVEVGYLRVWRRTGAGLVAEPCTVLHVPRVLRTGIARFIRKQSDRLILTGLLSRHVGRDWAGFCFVKLEQVAMTDAFSEEYGRT